MRNNKGYSLTELLVTIVIFGIVMTGIAMIMRTSSISYTDGNTYVTMQTEAQIITNQIEDLLVDATSYTGEGIVSGNRYYAFESAGKVHYLIHDANADKMYYQSGTTLSSDVEDWQLMAEYVDTFSISGYVTDDTSPDYDNIVTINVGMNKRGYTYASSKDVFFRNAIENSGVQQISGESNNNNNNNSDITATIVLDRYAIIDLEKEYGLNPATITVSPGFDAWYKFVSTTYNTTVTNNQYNKKVQEVFTNCSYYVNDPNTTDDDVLPPFITTNTTLNGDFTEEITASADATISGTKHDGTPVKFLITTPKVTYHVEDEEGAVILSPLNADAKTRDNWIIVDGIDFASMLDNPMGTEECKIQYSLVFYKDHDANQIYSKSAQAAQKVGVNGNGPTPSSKKEITSSGTGVFADQQQPQMDFGLKVDPSTGDLSILAGEVMESSTTFNAGNTRLAVMIEVSKKTATGWVTAVTDYDENVIDLPVFVQGEASGNAQSGYTVVSTMDLSNFTGGNKYKANDWGIVWYQ